MSSKYKIKFYMHAPKNMWERIIPNLQKTKNITKLVVYDRFYVKMFNDSWIKTSNEQRARSAANIFVLKDRRALPDTIILSPRCCEHAI